MYVCVCVCRYEGRKGLPDCRNTANAGKSAALMITSHWHKQTNSEKVFKSKYAYSRGVVY